MYFYLSFIFIAIYEIEEDEEPNSFFLEEVKEYFEQHKVKKPIRVARQSSAGIIIAVMLMWIVMLNLSSSVPGEYYCVADICEILLAVMWAYSSLCTTSLSKNAYDWKRLECLLGRSLQDIQS